MPGGNRPLHVWPAQVQVAVGQSKDLVNLAVFHNLKGRRLRFGKQPQLGNIELHLPGGQIGIFGLPLSEQSRGRHHIFSPQRGGLLKNSPFGGVIKGELQKPGAVPQVHKNKGT
ncbi:hypothetical protein SDC9_122828 [bioreactor metagenome]|uniref:Uncharacterized protein n=1 Tax=bioreactor metagenome TaxID=1076179 RepID=A0A645CFV8_9ZZZZ